MAFPLYAVSVNHVYERKHEGNFIIYGWPTAEMFTENITLRPQGIQNSQWSKLCAPN